MKSITPQDIELENTGCHIGFKGLTSCYDDEECTPIEPLKTEVKPLTTKEIISKYDVSVAVAEKLIAYQSSVLAEYQREVERIIGLVDRYNEIKPHIENRKLDKDILSQYIDSTMNHTAMLKEFRPVSHLRNGLIGVVISYVLYLSVTTMGWHANPPKEWSEFITLGIVALAWLGITTMAAWRLPSRYRARKIIYGILKAR